MEKLILERIKENENLFNKKELKFIYGNDSIIKKIYLIGFINAKQIYGNNLQ